MTVFIKHNCLNHPKVEAKYWIYVKNKGYGVCKGCIKWLNKIHQLSIARLVL